MAAVLLLPAGGVSSAPPPPQLFVDASDWSRLGVHVSLTFEADHLASAGEAERFVISLPAGFAFDAGRPTAAHPGSATLVLAPLGGGSAQTFPGRMTALSAADYATNRDAQACSPGTHAGAWLIDTFNNQFTGRIDVPIAIDISAAGGYTLTMCFEPLHAIGWAVSTIGFGDSQDSGATSALPAHVGRYAIQAIVTPRAADGSENAAAAYEIRSVMPLPQALTAKASYNPKTRTLTVSGSYKAARKPVVGADIRVWNEAAAGDVLLGHARTQPGGTYTFRQRTARPPQYVFTDHTDTVSAVCAPPSPAPAGCRSVTTHGAGSHVVWVTQR